MRNQTYKYQHLWTKMVDNFADSYGQWICSFFPIIFLKCSFKSLEISVKIQLPDFRLFDRFLTAQMKCLPGNSAAKRPLWIFCGH